jgi:hypothetical protein
MPCHWLRCRIEREGAGIARVIRCNARAQCVVGIGIREGNVAGHLGGVRHDRRIPRWEPIPLKAQLKIYCCRCSFDLAASANSIRRRIASERTAGVKGVLLRDFWLVDEPSDSKTAPVR